MGEGFPLLDVIRPVGCVSDETGAQSPHYQFSAKGLLDFPLDAKISEMAEVGENVLTVEFVRGVPDELGEELAVEPASGRHLAPRLERAGQYKGEEVLADGEPRQGPLVHMVVHGLHEPEVPGGGEEAGDHAERVRLNAHGLPLTPGALFVAKKILSSDPR